jgi:hypothetical protein
MRPGSALADSLDPAVNRCNSGVGRRVLRARIVAETSPRHLRTEQICLPGSRPFLPSRAPANWHNRRCPVRRSYPTLVRDEPASGSCSARCCVASRLVGCGLLNGSIRLAGSIPNQADARSAPHPLANSQRRTPNSPTWTMSRNNAMNKQPFSFISEDVTVVGDLYIPDGPARGISVVTGPLTSVKEQGGRHLRGSNGRTGVRRARLRLPPLR